MGFMNSFKKSQNNEQGSFEVNGITVTCTHCGSTSFTPGEAQLNTAGMTFLGLDWANKSASILTCDFCGKIEWFITEPEPEPTT